MLEYDKLGKEWCVTNNSVAMGKLVSECEIDTLQEMHGHGQEM